MTTTSFRHFQQPRRRFGTWLRASGCVQTETLATFNVRRQVRFCAQGLLHDRLTLRVQSASGLRTWVRNLEMHIPALRLAAIVD